jgi:hypothetical protein
MLLQVLLTTACSLTQQQTKPLPTQNKSNKAAAAVRPPYT